jgi:hypothetical protein
MITTPDDLYRARKRLGWSVYEMADALRLTGTREKAGQRVREMEAGDKPISGPVAVAVESFLAGYWPEHIPKNPT